jgi:hypothetical protein
MNLVTDITSQEECDQMKEIMEIYFIRNRIKELTLNS